MTRAPPISASASVRRATFPWCGSEPQRMSVSSGCDVPPLSGAGSEQQLLRGCRTGLGDRRASVEQAGDRPYLAVVAAVSEGDRPRISLLPEDGEREGSERREG